MSDFDWLDGLSRKVEFKFFRRFCTQRKGAVRTSSVRTSTPDCESRLRLPSSLLIAVNSAPIEMQCSSAVPVSRGLAVPSPSLLTVASANGNVLEIRHINTLSLLHSITTSGTNITHIVWSPSSGILAAASIPSNSIVLVNPTTGAILADVHDSPLPIASLSLSSTGVLLVSSVHSIAVSLFSVHRAKLLAVIPFITHRSTASPIFAWSPCGRFVALATRKHAFHRIVIVSLANGNIVTSLQAPEQLSGISEVSGLRWLPSGNIVLWGSPLDQLSYDAVALISPSGKLLSKPVFLEPKQDLNDEKLEDDTPPRRLSNGSDHGKLGLGIKNLAVNPQGSLLAIGGYDGILRIINIARWRVIKTFGHESPEINTSHPPVIFRERMKDELESDIGTENDSSSMNARKRRFAKPRKRRQGPKRSYFQVLETESAVEITKRVHMANATGSNTFGVSAVEFSPDGKYLSSRSDKAGNVVFIWDVANLRLSAVLVFERDVKIIRWSKPILDGDGELEGSQLALSCGEEFVYIWKRSGAAAVTVNADFNWQTPFKARKLSWSHDNSALLVSDGISANAFMSVYVTT